MSDNRGKKRRVRSFFSDMLDWLSGEILEQAKKEQAKESVKSHDRFFHVHDFIEVRKKVVDTKSHLQQVKHQLRKKHGESAGCFISRCLDPMIKKVDSLIEKIDGEKDPFVSFLDQAISEVRAFSELDEKKLVEKIVDDAHRYTFESIDKDRMILQEYFEQAMQKAAADEKNRIKRFLTPIFLELEALTEKTCKTDDLEYFFSWKIKIDERREELVELGFTTIDGT